MVPLEILGFLFLKSKLAALPSMPGTTTIILIITVAAGIVAWLVLEKLLLTLPAVLHCNVCGTRLRRLEVLANLRYRPERTYPFRRVDGVREEQQVRALCHKCTRRAHRHRRQLAD
jgi:hypothetical protein